MKLTLLCTPSGFKVCDDESYEEKRKLRNGETYTAEIHLARNSKFHRKYMAFMRVSFSCLPPEVQQEYFGGRWENWRNELELIAGSYDVVFSFETKKMEHRHRSISFGKMTEEEFQDLYGRVREYAWSIIGKYVTPEAFEQRLINF